VVLAVYGLAMARRTIAPRYILVPFLPVFAWSVVAAFWFLRNRPIRNSVPRWLKIGGRITIATMIVIALAVLASKTHS
jgi:hypothetical protein